MHNGERTAAERAKYSANEKADMACTNKKKKKIEETEREIDGKEEGEERTALNEAEATNRY